MKLDISMWHLDRVIGKVMQILKNMSHIEDIDESILSVESDKALNDLINGKIKC